MSSPTRAVIPLHAAPEGAALLAPPEAVGPHLRDTLGRPLRDLRISVTDRCNFRCSYCMPKSVFDRNHRFLPQADLLSFEEITRVAQACLPLGVKKIRITGGEPLLRKQLPTLIQQLADLRQPNGQPLDLTLTTNASLLARQAEALRNAGLQRLTISLDALDDATFRRMNDMDFAVADVLHGIDAAQRAGFTSIKVNMVVQRGVNDDQIVPMATYFRGRGITLRFIEYMDVGHTNGWQMQQVLPSAEVKQRVHDQFPLLPLAASAPGETAQRWGYANAQGQHDPALGEIGFISSVTQAFCGDCNRARLSTEGRLFLCLFAGQGHDLRHWLRQGEDAATLSARIAGIWQGRTNQYSALRGQAQASAPDQPKVEMSYIGG